MRLPSQLARWGFFLLLLNCFALPRASSQHSAPIKKTGLIEALGTGGLSASELARIIGERGVDFRLTYDNEQDLLKAGASPDVLDAVRKHYRHASVSTADRAKAANLVRSASALLDAHNADGALPVVNQALELDPDNADAYALRAKLYFASGDSKRGMADANIALEIDPGNNGAQQLLRPGRNVEAATANPSTSSGEIPAAGHQVWFGFRERPRKGQVVVLGVLPNSSAERGGLLPGDVTVSANGMSVNDFFEQFVKPGKLAAGTPVNLVILRQGQQVALQLTAQPRPNPGDEAIRYFGQLIQRAPGNPEAYIYRAAAYADLKNFPAAMQDVNTFIRLNPSDPQGYEVRAFIKTSQGDPAGAKADQDQAARLMPPDNVAAPGNSGNPGNNPNAAAAIPFPERWTLLQYNRSFKIKQIENHIYFQGLNIQATADAEKGTDKKGNVVYKGKWHQTNANGTFSEWRMELKVVTPQRIEGTVYTKIIAGDTVTFLPEN